ncbi:hypothetical protein B7H23_15690 [Notoacmeibacter marinus]|uniref:Uncharacterized protein n=1 Tax=Notoacmeibacter marinus TaxID=1876515 RepID=A0A231UUS0_9HYPH|nr:hypothetical protein [Notoacmeibacter marinus]OXS99570.1 hypothetical protein B7H23_15690 [Notoacmeibacter marinus]
MPQLIIAALAGVAAAAAYRMYQTESERVSRTIRDAEDDTETPQGTLVRDPETGEYRLKQ